MLSKTKNFIRLGDRILNVNMIKKIHIYPNRYDIEFITSGNGGSSGFLIGGTGWITKSDNYDNLYIFKDQSPKEYDYLTEWIEKNI